MDTPDCESEAISAQRTPKSGPGTIPYSFATLGVCVSSVAGIHAAHADGLDADSAENSGTLEQVVVPGVGSLLENKLPENLQDTPQSISVVSQKRYRPSVAG